MSNKFKAAILMMLAFTAGIHTGDFIRKYKGPIMELPNGSHVHAAKVKHIYTLPFVPADKYSAKSIPDRVIVAIVGGDYEMIPCASFKEAEIVADNLAAEADELAFHYENNK